VDARLVDRARDVRRAEAEPAQRGPDLGDDVGRVGRGAGALEAQRVRRLAGDAQVTVMDRGVVMRALCRARGYAA
jgi:hypothetical protein